MLFPLLFFGLGLGVGSVGSMLGIGGGVFLIPVLTGFFGVPIKVAIGASVVAVIATSSAAGAVYVDRGFTNTRLAMVLEIATTIGALAGGITAVLINPNVLAGVFAAVLVYAAYAMGHQLRGDSAVEPTGLLDASYVDPQTGERVAYGARSLPTGLGASFLAGNVSGLLGIGGGIIKVPIMASVMRIPLRAAIGTSNFMIGITAATSAVVYYRNGLVDPSIAVPVTLGVLAGAQIGTRVGARVHGQVLRRIFQAVLFLFAAQMAYKAFWGAT